MKKLTQILFILLFGLVITLFVIILKSDTQIKFVSVTEVYSASNLRKDYEKKIEDFETQSNANLKAFQSEITRKEKLGTSVEEIILLRQELNEQQFELSEQYKEKSELYQNEVWQELNSQIEEYGKLNNYKFILGGTGNGAIMYVEKTENITKDVIKYINEK